MPPTRNTSPLFTLIAAVVVIASLHFAKEILLPLALAVLFAFLLTPLLNRIERLRLGRILSVLLVVGFTFTIFGVLGWIVTSQLIDISRQLPEVKSNVIAKIRAVRPSSKTLSRVTDTLDDLSKELSTKDNEQAATEKEGNEKSLGVESKNKVEPQNELAKIAEAVQAIQTPANARKTAPSNEEPAAGDADEAVKVNVVSMPPSPLAQIQTWLGPLVAPLTTFGMVVVLVLFILIDRENQRDRLIQLFGSNNLHTTTEAFVEATGRVSRYLRMQFLINAGYGICIGIGLWLLGVPSAVTWGVLGFSLRFLPYVGPWIAAAMPITVSFAFAPGWAQPLYVVTLFAVLELILNNVAEPLLYGNSVGISSVGVILSAIFWTWLWGPVGLILAMPITVCLMVMARYVPQLRFLTVLLGDRPVMTLPERIYQRLLAFDYHEPLKMAQKYLKSETLANFYDEALIPALKLAEEDRHAGQLNEDQEAFVQEAAEDLVEEMGESAMAQPETPPSDDATPPLAADLSAARIFCIPLRDEADEITSRMLAQLLAVEGFHVEMGAADALTSELVERVAKQEIDLVVISILPPIAPRDSRLLWKRLRHRYPDLPIIIGFWSGTHGIEKLVGPEDGHASRVATTLDEAVALVRSTAAGRRVVVAKTG